MMDTTNISPLFGPYGSAALEYITCLKDTGRMHLVSRIQLGGFKSCQKHHIAACVEFKTFRQISLLTLS